MEVKAIDWARIKVLLLDSDGVLTDGGVYIPETGSPEIRRFDIKDGFGITRLIERGFPIGVISRSPSTPVQTRCERLGIKHIYLGTQDKVSAAEKILTADKVEWSEAAFMGDDIPDLPLLARVGLAAAPRNASAEVLEKADWVSSFRGGSGAVREICDLLYRAHY